MIECGYELEDLLNFRRYWLQGWRYAKDKRAPKVEDVLDGIYRAKLMFKGKGDREQPKRLQELLTDDLIPEHLRKKS